MNNDPSNEQKACENESKRPVRVKAKREQNDSKRPVRVSEATEFGRYMRNKAGNHHGIILIHAQPGEAVTRRLF